MITKNKMLGVIKTTIAIGLGIIIVLIIAMIIFVLFIWLLNLFDNLKKG